MADRWGRTVAGFAAFQVGDAVACATLDVVRRELERLGCPPAVRRLLPVIKVASGAGLLLGRRWPRLGHATGGALAAYFACAIGFHVRARDPWWRSAPAAALLGFSLAIALRGAGEEPQEGAPAVRAGDAVVELVGTGAAPQGT
jgi:hypothetical protein